MGRNSNSLHGYHSFLFIYEEIFKDFMHKMHEYIKYKKQHNTYIYKKTT